MRNPINSPAEKIFGSKARTEILYLLMATNGSWLNAHNIAEATNIDYKTISMVLRKMSNENGEIQKHPRGRNYRIKPHSRLRKGLEILFEILFPERLMKYDSKNYWSVTKGNYSYHYLHSYWKANRNYTTWLFKDSKDRISLSDTESDTDPDILIW